MSIAIPEGEVEAKDARTMPDEQATYEQQLKIVEKIRLQSRLSIVLVLVAFLIGSLMLGLRLPIEWRITLLLVSCGPAMIFAGVVAYSRCPQCGGLFFARWWIPSGIYWSYKDCQKCGFPKKSKYDYAES